MITQEIVSGNTTVVVDHEDEGGSPFLSIFGPERRFEAMARLDPEQLAALISALSEGLRFKQIPVVAGQITIRRDEESGSTNLFITWSSAPRVGSVVLSPEQVVALISALREGPTLGHKIWAKVKRLGRKNREKHPNYEGFLRG